MGIVSNNLTGVFCGDKENDGLKLLKCMKVKINTLPFSLKWPNKP